jgi:hypothetical protein
MSLIYLIQSFPMVMEIGDAVQNSETENETRADQSFPISNHPIGHRL